MSGFLLEALWCQLEQPAPLTQLGAPFLAYPRSLEGEVPSSAPSGQCVWCV